MNNHWTKQLPGVGMWSDRIAMDADEIRRRIVAAEQEVARLYDQFQRVEADAFSIAKRHYSIEEISAAIEANAELMESVG